jgi:hypothetical protein
VNRNDIKLYGEYRLNVGSKGGEAAKRQVWGENRRCIVLGTDMAYVNPNGGDSLWGQKGQLNRYGSHRRVVITNRNDSRRRIYVAVAIPVLESQIDVEVTDHEYLGMKYSDRWGFMAHTGDDGKVSYIRRKTVEVETVWVPFAAATKDILESWEDFEERLAEQKEKDRLSNIASEQARIAREAEQAIRREEAEERTRQNQRRQAVATEHYKTRILPTLVEVLGEAPYGFSAQWMPDGTSTVTLTMDQAEKLVELVSYLSERQE